MMDGAVRCLPIIFMLWAHGAPADDNGVPAGDGPQDAVELESLKIFPDLDDLGALPGRLSDSVPCLGCEGLQRDPVPLGVRLGADLGLAGLRMFFQQPRARGEPQDEALYQVLRYELCPDDLHSSCIDRHPNPHLQNWEP